MGKLSSDLSRLMLLLVGDSGMGKTGSTAALAKAGYSLRYLDFDNGTHIIKNVLKDEPNSKELLDNIYVEKCQDSFKNINGRVIAKTPLRAWPKAVELLSNWKVGKEGEPGSYNLGPITSWTSQDVLILDSLTHAGDAAMRYHQSLNAKLGTNPTLPDWGIVQTMIKDLLEMLKDDAVKCHIIVNTHIDWRYRDIRGGKDDSMVIGRELEGGYPSAPGNKLPEKVGSYFNDALQAIKQGTGTGARYRLTTVPMQNLGLKSSNPKGVKRDYPIEDGLAQYFKDVLG